MTTNPDRDAVIAEFIAEQNRMREAAERIEAAAMPAIQRIVQAITEHPTTGAAYRPQ